LFHQFPLSVVCPEATSPPEAVVLGKGTLLLVATAAGVLVLVMTMVVVPEPACSEAPSSLPQLVVYHVITCWLSLVEVQTESQMPLGEV
jgi:hypothetical protein